MHGSRANTSGTISISIPFFQNPLIYVEILKCRVRCSLLHKLHRRTLSHLNLIKYFLFILSSNFTFGFLKLHLLPFITILTLKAQSRPRKTAWEEP